MTRIQIKHLTIRVEGIVQGVGFRWSVRTRAAQLGVAGYVCNEDDGSVLIEAEAEEAVLDAFLAWCQKGPVSARVEKVTATPGPIKPYTGFSIRFD